MILVFVDTNVLPYSVDDQDPAKQKGASDWLTMCWRRHCGRVSTRVLNAFYSNARRPFSSAISKTAARSEVRRYEQWQPWTIDQPTIETAWALESRFQANSGDALMAAAAQHPVCTQLLTEDLQHGQRFDSVRVVKPFLAGPETLTA